MTPFTTVTGVAVPFGAANVDTDVIIPARFLKTVHRAGLGRHAFATLRGEPDERLRHTPPRRRPDPDRR